MLRLSLKTRRQTDGQLVLLFIKEIVQVHCQPPLLKDKFRSYSCALSLIRRTLRAHRRVQTRALADTRVQITRTLMHTLTCSRAAIFVQTALASAMLCNLFSHYVCRRLHWLAV